MSSPTPLEAEILRPVLSMISEASNSPDESDHTLRLEVLEAAACQIGGIPLARFRAASSEDYELSTLEAKHRARPVVGALECIPIHPALALASLAQRPLSRTDQRRGGEYYTDFRLARLLARSVADQPFDHVIDPACGTGILLAALAIEHFGHDRSSLTSFIGNHICGADLSRVALRGTRLSLASLTNDYGAIKALNQRLRCADSLTEGPQLWTDVAPSGFKIVIGNPPWEKLRVTRHEHLEIAGEVRHYGDDYAVESLGGLASAKAELNDYVQSIADGLHDSGETDLYRLFLALSFELVQPSGALAILVPGGLIRSSGTKPLRDLLFRNSSRLDISILDNKSRFFSIDTRFKFVAVSAILDGRNASSIRLRHMQGTPDSVEQLGAATIGYRQLRKIRPDLSVPEVRSNDEWGLFTRLSEQDGGATNVKNWEMKIVREVDMTTHRPMFRREFAPGLLPVIEGRMVHQYRHGAKAYVSGTGRRAVWESCPAGDDKIRPQFWISPKDLPPGIESRIADERVGFCDVTGQTNERSMLAASIPAGVVCGNKVPTVSFNRNHQFPHLHYLWLGVANSFIFDWLLRRVLTTTVNFFILRSVPLPSDPSAPIACEIADLAERVVREARDLALSEVACLRARIDALVLLAYGLGARDAILVLDDFPLLDRHQPPLPGERRSTVTRDLVLSQFTQLLGAPDETSARRSRDAAALGAIAYLPSQFSVTRA